MSAPRRISVLGATGSVGENTIDLVQGAQGFQVVALTGGRNVARLARMARDLQAEVAVAADDALLGDRRQALAGSGIEAAAGPAARAEAASRPTDWVMSAIVGAAGLAPGMAALAAGATLALANKESLVTAGPLILSTAARLGARILPVDSEQSAIFQAQSGFWICRCWSRRRWRGWLPTAALARRRQALTRCWQWTTSQGQSRGKKPRATQNNRAGLRYWISQA